MIKARRYLLYCFLMALPALVKARAGGGGGHGGGGFSGGGHSHGSHGNGDFGITSILIIIGIAVWAVYTVWISYLLLKRSGKASSLLQKSAASDAIWDHRKMKALADKMFKDMQYAWGSRSMASVSKKVTQSLYDDYTVRLCDMKEKGERNIIRDIEIADIKIISCEDYQDNSKDKFIAYIQGSILDYTVNEYNNAIISNQERRRENFTDAYHFVREGSLWKLDRITNDAALFTLLEARNVFEES